MVRGPEIVTSPEPVSPTVQMSIVPSLNCCGRGLDAEPAQRIDAVIADHCDIAAQIHIVRKANRQPLLLGAVKTIYVKPDILVGAEDQATADVRWMHPDGRIVRRIASGAHAHGLCEGRHVCRNDIIGGARAGQQRQSQQDSMFHGCPESLVGNLNQTGPASTGEDRARIRTLY